MDPTAAAGLQTAMHQAQTQQQTQYAAMQQQQRQEAQVADMLSDTLESTAQTNQSAGEQDTSMVPSTAEAEGRGTQVDYST